MPVEQNLAIAVTLNMIASLIGKLGQRGLFTVQEVQDIGQAALTAATEPQDREQVLSLLKELFPTVKFD